MGRLTDTLRKIRIRRELEEAKVLIEFVQAPAVPDRIAPPRRYDAETGKMRPLPQKPLALGGFIIMGMPPPVGEQPDWILNNNGWLPTGWVMLNYFPEYGATVPDLPEEGAAVVARRADQYRRRWRMF